MGLGGRLPSLLITLQWMLPCLFSWEDDCIMLCPQLIRLHIHMLMIHFIQPLCHSRPYLNDFHKSVFQQAERWWAVNRATILARHKNLSRNVPFRLYFIKSSGLSTYTEIFPSVRFRAERAAFWRCKIMKNVFDCNHLESETVKIPQSHS